MWTLFLLLLPSISRCAPPFSQDLKNCDDSGPRVSELSLNSALSTFLCYTEEEIGAMEEVEKKRKLAQKIAPLFRYEHSYEDLVEELLKVPSDSLVKIVNEVMNNRNAEIDHNTVEEYRSVFDEHIHLNNGLEDLERNGRNAFLSNFESWFSFGEGPYDSPNTATPQILTLRRTLRVSVGDSVLLPCSVHNLGSLVPLWKHKQNVLTAGRQMVNPDTYKYQLVNDYNLQIRNIRDLDAGDYTCYITTFGKPVTLTHTIVILGLVTDGGWSEWSTFSRCSATCGDATKRRTRTCTQPVPANGGKDCVESNEESVSCGLQTCVCAAGATNSVGCFCKSDDGESGDACSANQGCTLHGTCLDVCDPGPYELEADCFCKNTKGGGSPCAAELICEDGVCIDVIRNARCGFNDYLLNPVDVEGKQQSGHDLRPEFKWTDKKVKYYYSDDNTWDEDKQIIRDVMDNIEKNTCFNFEEGTKLDLEDKQHCLEIDIYKYGGTLWGYVSVEERPVHLDKKPRIKLVLRKSTTLLGQNNKKPAYDGEGKPKYIYYAKGLILHELMHVLGVGHTQRRSDRDTHIEVFKDKVDEHVRSQYTICAPKECALYDSIPYECESIMHYGTEFEGKEVIIPRDKSKCILEKRHKCLRSLEVYATKKDWELLRIIGECPCSTNQVVSEACWCNPEGPVCSVGQTCTTGGKCTDPGGE